MLPYKQFQQLRKKAANDFWNWGAGRVANDEIHKYDTEASNYRAILEEASKAPGANPDAPAIFDEAYAAERAKIIDAVRPVVRQANLQGGIVGGMAGIAGGGLTYAGLGLIPGLKNRKGLRLLAGLTAGIPLGAYVADRTAEYQGNRED